MLPLHHEHSEPLRRIERRTSRLQGECSNQLSYKGNEPRSGIEPEAPFVPGRCSPKLSYIGMRAKGGSRTRCLSLTRGVLYQLSYSGNVRPVGFEPTA